MTVTESLINTYTESDALDLAKLVKQGEVTPVELVEAAVTCIERLNPELNAVVHKLYDLGREAAASVDHNALFAGVPFLLKELVTQWKGTPAKKALLPEGLSVVRQRPLLPALFPSEKPVTEQALSGSLPPVAALWG
ncbi:amidase [Xenorhabdus budapestensis]|uniref:Amidase n=1 Tax=Xenorhabdus budapestensis TaxID=290110 RepID=A0A2D0J0H4_XENBU|nr:amidase [Xenorhabdus budapestensis]